MGRDGSLPARVVVPGPVFCRSMVGRVLLGSCSLLLLQARRRKKEALFYVA